MNNTENHNLTIRLGLLPDSKHTHICKRPNISYETGIIEHE